MLPIARTFVASVALLTVQACALPADYYTPVTIMPEPAARQPSSGDQQSGIEWFKENSANPWKFNLNNMVDASAPIAVQSGLCGYWDHQYWQIKIITAGVEKDVPGLAERFRLASLKEVERLQKNPSDRIPCGSGLRELALMYLTDWSLVTTR